MIVEVKEGGTFRECLQCSSNLNLKAAFGKVYVSIF
jgi:hypothetical protein